MINVNSEIGALQKVIIHRPDEGIARISPKKAEELLFDDIVHLPQMKAEHDIFRKVLQLMIGEENVLDTVKLIIEGFEASPERIRRCYLSQRSEDHGGIAGRQ